MPHNRDVSKRSPYTVRRLVRGDAYELRSHLPKKKRSCFAPLFIRGNQTGGSRARAHETPLFQNRRAVWERWDQNRDGCPLAPDFPRLRDEGRSVDPEIASGRRASRMMPALAIADHLVLSDRLQRTRLGVVIISTSYPERRIRSPPNGRSKPADYLPRPSRVEVLPILLPIPTRPRNTASNPPASGGSR